MFQRSDYGCRLCGVCFFSGGGGRCILAMDGSTLLYIKSKWSCKYNSYPWIFWYLIKQVSCFLFCFFVLGLLVGFTCD